MGWSQVSTVVAIGWRGEVSEPQREILPIPDRPYVGVTTYDARDPDSNYPSIVPLRPPAGAPNVLVVLLDDVGFGASSSFGGPVSMPTAERLAGGGLSYTRFHTTAMCAPTRAALLNGRNSHTVGMGTITEMATSAPGVSSVRPNTCVPLPEVLRLNGYATGQFGKCHEVPVWEASPAGPFDRWPTGSGFEYFYGFLGGETNQWYPALYENTVAVEPWGTPEQGYHFMADMTDRAISWARRERALTPDRPFFMYFAPGATHAPHHVPAEWADKYKGRFDHGWDALREETFARQKQMGIVPADCDLTERHDAIPAWADMDEAMKPVLARQMEVYAGYLEYADHHVGRLVDALEGLDVLDDTLVYYVIGDNGASLEGTVNGSLNEIFIMNHMQGIETPEYLREHIDLLGGPHAYNHYATGWAHAMDTPYQWAKQFAGHWGGTRNGAIVHWPTGTSAMGELRTQFHHVIDVAPTILEAAGLPQPTTVYGITQKPIEGFSMRSSFDDADAPENHETQYFEIMCNRGIYHRGWVAAVLHRLPGEAPLRDLADDVWELYDTTSDWTEAHDLAAEHPDKLAELQRLFLIEASKYNVLPLDDRSVERINPDTAGRPTLVHGNSQVLFGDMGRLTEATVLNTKNKSHSVTAEIEVPDGGAEGVIIAQGGRFGGWTLYTRENTLRYAYSFFGMETSTIAADKPLPTGKHQVRMEFAYDGGGVGKGGDVSLYLDGDQVAAGRIERTHIAIFSAEETTDVGRETGSPVTDDYPDDNTYTGTIDGVRIEIGDDDHSHLIDPEHLLAIALTIQ
jgi:arylsulfatase A-like enzyme